MDRLKILLFLILVLPLYLHAEDKAFSFNFGDKVNIYSDKAFKTDDINKLIGNVVIAKKEETLYGESAQINMKTGWVEVEGNVRFVSSTMTVYGSKLTYDTNTEKLTIENARVISDSYTLISKTITKISDDVFVAEEAEYTTCRDCPESWSVYGKNVRIKVDNYIQIKSAMIRINGVNILYVPYMVLPIKNERETGLLFPSFSLFNREGVSYQQPWFWAISRSSDLTITPSTWGKRGYGSDFEYRQLFGQEKWLNINARTIQDKIYKPYKATTEVSSKETFRQFSETEYHFQVGNWLTHHTRYTNMKDLDFVRVFRAYTDPKISGSELGLSSFFDMRVFDRASLSLQGDYNQNMLVSNPTYFDPYYVQVLPQSSLNTIPVKIFNSSFPMLQNISTGFEANHTLYRQKEKEETIYLRNVDRLHFAPYLDWNFMDLGPVHLKSQYRHEYQTYDFRADNQPNFTKSSGTIISEASFEIDRIFGLSYKEKVTIDRIDPLDLKKIEEKKIAENPDKFLIKKEKKTNLISSIPSFDEALTDDFVVRTRSSYRHSQDFKFRHYYTTEQKTKGNDRFYNQIQDPKGWFDYLDAIRTKENTLGSNLTRTTISPANTLEMQWNNSVIKKSAKTYNTFEDGLFLRDNFSYSKIGFFNVSQGYQLNTQSSRVEDNLTRLFTTTGYTINRFTFGISDYYFYQSANHITGVNASQGFSFGNIFTSVNLNSFDNPTTAITVIGGNIRPIDILNFYAKYDYNYGTKTPINALYGFDYIPNSNCWRFNINLNKSVVEQRIAFNIFVNFADNTFTPLNSSSTNTSPTGASSAVTGSPTLKKPKNEN